MALCPHCGASFSRVTRYCSSCGDEIVDTGLSKVKDTAAIPGSNRSDESPSQDVGATRQSPAGLHNFTLAAGIIALIGFVLPWVSCPGIQDRVSASGYDLASKGGASSLWLVPICVLAAICLVVLQIVTKRVQYTLGIAWAGICSLMVPLVKYLFAVADTQNDLIGFERFTWEQVHFEPGLFVTLFGTLAVSAGGLLMTVRFPALHSDTDRTPMESGIGESVRWVMVCVLSLPLAVVALQRMSLSALLPVLRNALHLTSTSVNTILAATSIAFALGAVLSGALIDRVGLRIGSLVSITALTLGQASSGFFEGLPGLLAARILFGLGGGAALPIAAKAVALYIRKSERAFAVALWQTALCIGVLYGIPLSVKLNISSGWKSVFLLTAVPGLVLSAIACFLPSRHTTHAGSNGFKLDRVLTSLISVHVIATLLSGCVLQSWAPSYLMRTLKVPMISVPAILYPIPLFTALGAVVGAGIFMSLRDLANDGRGGIYRWPAVVSAILVVCGTFGLFLGSTYAATLAINSASFGVGALLVSVYSAVLNSRPHGRAAFNIGLVSCISTIFSLALNTALGQVIEFAGLPAAALGLAIALLIGSLTIGFGRSNADVACPDI